MRLSRTLAGKINGASWFPEIVFRGTFPLWLAIVLMVAIAGLAGAFYFTESMKIGLGRRLLLTSLRALVLCTIIFLLCKPVAVRDVASEKSRPIVILADNSQSMKQKDPRPAVADKVRFAIAKDILPPDHGLNTPASVEGLPGDRPTRADVVKAAFANKRLDLVGKLRPKGPVQPFLFGSGCAAWRTEGTPGPAIRRKTRSLLTDTLRILQRRRGCPPQSSSSPTARQRQRQWNASPPAARLGVPFMSTASAARPRGSCSSGRGHQDALFVEHRQRPFRWRSGVKDGESS